jgi:hypothetical protein
LWDDPGMGAVQVDRLGEDCGCWVLWCHGRVVAEGSGRLRLALARVWLALPLPRR